MKTSAKVGAPFCKTLPFGSQSKAYQTQKPFCQQLVGQAKTHTASFFAFHSLSLPRLFLAFFFVRDRERSWWKDSGLKRSRSLVLGKTASPFIVQAQVRRSLFQGVISKKKCQEPEEGKKTEKGKKEWTKTEQPRSRS